MTRGWREKLEGGELLLIDGGTGSELKRRGAALDATAWSGLAARDHPRLLERIHADYAKAGAEILIANTFAGARYLFEAAGGGEHWERTNRRALEIALSIRDRYPPGGIAVAGSISNLPPGFDVGAYPSAEREAADYRELAALIAASGADLIILEMLQDPVHAGRALSAAQAAAQRAGLPLWLGVSVRRHERHGTLVGFDLQEQAFAKLLDDLLPWQPDAVCIMHSELDAVPEALALLRSRWGGPIGVYPELPYRLDGAAGFATTITPEAFAAQARRWVQAGARMLGGCCGTTPAHIAALRQALPELRAYA